MSNRKAIILAAGKGTRLHSAEADLPKALRRANGKTLISYVLENIDFIAPEDTCIVVGYMGEKIREALGPRYRYVEQLDQKGTAHATRFAQPIFGDAQGSIMVLYCDMPLLSRATYLRMFEEHEQSGAAGTLLAARIHPIPAFGRLVRDSAGELVDIVEDSACTPVQREIDEVNVGIQVLQSPLMWDYLARISNDNPKREYYLTGIVRAMARDGLKQCVVHTARLEETWGVNSLEDLRQVEAELLRL
ncbi:MAG: NTP transferase domain-containing protein [Oscillospiraceae bacterium]|nr:NTP transferase domain-containing protein [Oscillospiraceae bacterium]